MVEDMSQVPNKELSELLDLKMPISKKEMLNLNEHEVMILVFYD